MYKQKFLATVAVIFLTFTILSGCGLNQEEPTDVSTKSSEEESLTNPSTEAEAATIAVKPTTKSTATKAPTTTIKKPTTAPSPVSVSIKNMTFSPAKITIKAGTKVTWTNGDSVGHTATSNNGAFDSGMLAKGKSWTYTFKTKGTFNYICTPHPWMKGTVVVN